MKKHLLMMFIFLIFMPISNSALLCQKGEANWDNCLNAFLNVTFNEDGSIKLGVNESYIKLLDNTTIVRKNNIGEIMQNATIIRNSSNATLINLIVLEQINATRLISTYTNITYLNVTGIDRNATFQGDVKIIGTLYGGSPVKIFGVNITNGMLVTSENIAYLHSDNRSWVLEMLGNATINRSIDLSSYNKSIDLSSYNKSIDLSLYNQSISLVNYPLRTELAIYLINNSDINITNLNVINANLGWTNLTNYPIACPIGNVFITQLGDAIICTEISTSAFFGNLNWTILYNNEAGTRFSISNATALIDNATIIRTYNLQGVQLENKAYKKENLTIDYPNLDTDKTNDLDLNALDNNTIIRTGNESWWKNIYYGIIDRFGDLNWTSLYDARADRWGRTNQTEYNDTITTSLNLKQTESSAFKRSNGTLLPFSKFISENLSRLGNININTSGSLNVSGDITFTSLSSFNCIGTDSTGKLQSGTCGGADASAYNRVSNFTPDYASEYSLTGYKLSNFTTNYDARSDRFGTENATALGFLTNNSDANFSTILVKSKIIIPSGDQASTSLQFLNDADTGLFQDTADRWSMVAGNIEFISFREATQDEIVFSPDGDDIDLNFRYLGSGASTALTIYGDTGYVYIPLFLNVTRINVSNMFVSQNITALGKINASNITATRFTGRIDCGMLDGGSDSDYCADTSGGADTSAYNNASNFTKDFAGLYSQVGFKIDPNFTAQVPQCSGTDKITSSDGNTLSCATDQTGGAGSGITFTQFNQTKATYSTISNTASALIGNLTLTLPSSGQVNIECQIIQSAAATTTGIQYSINLTGATANSISTTVFSQGSTPATCGGGGNVTCVYTVSGGAIQHFTLIDTYVRQMSTAGLFRVFLRSEVASTQVNVLNGSWCRSIQHNFN